MPEHRTTARYRQQEMERMAVDTFETKEEASLWLKEPHPILGEKSPLQMAETETGTLKVKSILAAIKYGGVL